MDTMVTRHTCTVLSTKPKLLEMVGRVFITKMYPVLSAHVNVDPLSKCFQVIITMPYLSLSVHVHKDPLPKCFQVMKDTLSNCNLSVVKTDLSTSGSYVSGNPLGTEVHFYIIIWK